MAVTISKTPPAITNLDSIDFEITNSTPSTATTISLGIAQLLELPSIPLTEKEQYPYSPTAFPINFRKNISSQLSTTLPDVSSNAIAVDNNISKQVAIKFFERVINNGVTTDGAENTSTIIKVINSSTRFDQEINDGFSQEVNYRDPFTVLTNRPQNFNLAYDQVDWLYILTTEETEVNIFPLTIFETTLNPIVHTLVGGSVHIVPIGTPNTTTPIDNSLIKAINILIRTPSKEQTYKIHLTDSCALKTILFQEAMGGISSVQFNEDYSMSSARLTKSVYASKGFSSTKAERLTGRGKKTLRSNGINKINLSRKSKIDFGYENFYKSFIHSKNHYIVKNGEIHRVHLQDGDFEVDNRRKEIRLNCVFEEHIKVSVPN